MVKNKWGNEPEKYYWPKSEKAVVRQFCTASAVLSSCRVVHSVSSDSVAAVFMASVKVQGLSLHSASSLVMIASISATGRNS